MYYQYDVPEPRPPYKNYLDGDDYDKPRVFYVVEDAKTCQEMRARGFNNTYVFSEPTVGRRCDVLIFALSNTYVYTRSTLCCVEAWRCCLRPGGLVVGDPYA